MKPEKSLHSLIENAPHEKLAYSIYDQSSQSGSYHPRNICVNDPTEQSSRWSSGSHDQSQYITLKLDNPTVACEILFGKFHRSHVCNLKEFKIYGGLEPDNMNEILHKGLTDDNKPEVFPIRYTFNDLIFPIQYIKIVPLATFGVNFNYSIWYVEVRGITDKDLMAKVEDTYAKYKEMETIRLCLKHFRQKNMMDVYETLKKKTGIELEDPLIGNLHQSLVVDGDFEEAENLIAKANDRNVFKSFVQEAKYTPTWQRIYASNDDGDSPCARGGHQLCIDPQREKIYLLGGWDGKRELSDFWCYHIKESRWKLLSPDTSMQGGPSARSCHTMCFDPTRKSIFVLGRFIEYRSFASPCSNNSSSSSSSTSNTHQPDPLYESDFYQYFIELDRWIKISENTQIDGGPALTFHHEMCVDPVGRKLYVFGGRVLTPEPTSSTVAYSGFYSYDMDKSVWKVLRYDINHIPTAPPPPPSPHINSTHLTVSEPPIGRRRSSNGSYVISPNTSQTIKSRTGHSMLLDPVHRKIYFFGGQRSNEFLTELYCYSIEEDKLTEIAHDFSKNVGPESGHTQRASIDVERQELYISIGYFQNKPTTVVRNCFFVYDIKNNTWEDVFELDNQDTARWKSLKDIEPYPRYTHQLVYNPQTQSHFIFGGHPGDVSNLYRRLDDFWQLHLTKPDTNQVVRKCLYLIRTRKLYELCKQADMMMHFKGHLLQPQNSSTVSKETKEALDYLRNKVAPLVNHGSKEEVNRFRQLCTHLCLSQDNYHVQVTDPHLAKSTEEIYFTDRTKLFQALLEFFPAYMKEPEGTLIDAVQIH